MNRIIALGIVAGLTLGAVDTAERVRMPPRPVLVAEWGSGSEPLRLLTAAVDVRIVGHLAETRATLTFHNPRPRPLAGDFYFPLPERATLSGYALDVNGRMVDAVVVEKRDVSQVFTSDLETAVDFGLTDPMTKAHFITRVSPIPAGGTRTIRVRFVANLIDAAEDESVYRLPLSFGDRIDELSLRIDVVRTATPPRVIDAAGLANFRFTERGDHFVAEQKFAKAAVSGDLVIALSEFGERAVQTERGPDGQTYFLIRDAMIPISTEHATTTLERIRVLWDTSGSRADADLEREISLLKRYLTTPAAAGAVVELQSFAVRPAAIQRFQMPAQLDALIATVEDLRYDGGTRFSMLDALPGKPQPDAILLFSDGVLNFGSDDPTASSAPVYAISSSPNANHAWLQDIARRTGGAHLDLDRLSDVDGIAEIGSTRVRLLSIAVSEGAVEETYPRLPSPVESPLAIVGKLLNDAAVITLVYGIDDRILEQRQFSVRRDDAVEGDLITRHWAERKLADLRAFPERNRKEIVETSKRHSIVTPETALVVFERLEDYVEHRSRPPAVLIEMGESYDAQIERLESRDTERRNSKLERVLTLWEQRVRWWKADFDYPRRFRYRPQNHREPDDAHDTIAKRDSTQVKAPSVRTFSDKIAEGLGSLDVTPVDLISPSLEMETLDEELEPATRFESWNPETPYLTTLRTAPDAHRFDLYLEQKNLHGRSPAFFLDCADFFRQRGELEISLQVLSNVAELEPEDPALIRAVAHRLVRLEQFDLAVLLLEAVVERRTREPQSFRDLALVLSQRAERNSGESARADYERALDLLAHVVMNDWDRHPEFEVIALMEFNRLFPLARKAGATRLPLDQRLIESLDVDLRIVMTWDAPSTDLDIRVIEPSGEEAFSRHDLTTIGGSTSRDVTDGYGPEVYLLRDAMRGTYRVESGFLGSPAADLIGAVTLQLDIFRNYGRRNEKHESVTLRLTERSERLMVAEIEF